MCISILLWLVEDIGEATLSTVLAVEVGGHEHSCTALLSTALAPQAVDLAVVIDLVVLQHRELDLPLLVLDLLGSGVVLLLPLLGSSPQSEHQVEGGLLLDIVIRKSAAILQLLASEDQSKCCKVKIKAFTFIEIRRKYQLYLC